MSSILDQIKNALFYKNDNTSELDLKKLAGLLGFGLTASGAIDFGPEKPAVGYNKPVPKFNAVRNRVQNTYDPNRRPGSGGQYYFTPTEYVRQSDSLFGDDLETYADDLQTAQDAAATQAKGLETLNRENLASYPAPVSTTPEETNTGIASLPPSIPTAEQQLAGQVNLGMADGGIVGLSHGGFHFTQPSTWGSAISDLGSSIKNTASNIGSSLKDMGSDMYKDVVYGPMQGPNLPSETHGSLANLDNPFGKTSYDYGPFTLSTDGTTAAEHFGSSDAEEERSRNYANYKRAIGAGAGEGVSQDYVRGRSDARAESFLGGQSYEDTAARAAAGADIDMSVYNNPLTSKVINGTTLVGYENEDGLFQPISYNDANRALAAGIVDNPDIMGTNNTTTDGSAAGGDGSTAGGDGSAAGGDGSTAGGDGSTAGGDGSTPANVWSAETYPVVTNIFSSLGQEIPTTVNSFDQTSTNNLISAITNFAALDTVEKQTSDIQYYESIANNTIAEDYPNETINGVPASEYFAEFTDKQRQSYQNLADVYKKLQELSEEELETALQELKTWDDFLGTYGQEGTGGAAYGGAIKGYAMGGMGQAPDLPSGLLKSTEDGMADTIPAQMGNQPINLSGGEYIMDAETVAFLGNGNTDSGAQKLDDFRENLRMAKNGGEDQGNQINSENFLGRLQQMGVA